MTRAATGRTIVDGWLHSGDAGDFDEEGYLYLADRRTDLYGPLTG